MCSHIGSLPHHVQRCVMSLASHPHPASVPMLHKRASRSSWVHMGGQARQKTAWRVRLMTSLLLRCLYTTQGAGAVCSHTQHARIHFHCMHPLTPSMCFQIHQRAPAMLTKAQSDSARLAPVHNRCAATQQVDSSGPKANNSPHRTNRSLRSWHQTLAAHTKRYKSVCSSKLARPAAINRPMRYFSASPGIE